MNVLLTADWHLTDKPADSYRFKFLDWLRDYVAEMEVSKIIVLGDITEHKDCHPSSLVNEIVRRIADLTQHCPMDILTGNHDYIDENCPFFKFLQYLPGVNFITHPTAIPDINSFYIPNRRHWYDAELISEWVARDYDYIFCHQLFTGAVSFSGKMLIGASPSNFTSNKTKIYAGDIHNPQIVGPVEYVGSPYLITFGDAFEPRVILLDTQSKNSWSIATPVFLHKKTITIHSIEELEAMRLGVDDLVKLIVSIPQDETQYWADIRSRIEDYFCESKADLHSMELVIETPEQKIGKLGKAPVKTNQDLYADYCKQANLPANIVEVGRELMK